MIQWLELWTKYKNKQFNILQGHRDLHSWGKEINIGKLSPPEEVKFGHELT